MEDSESPIANINKKVSEIGNKFNALQDLILIMKNELSIIKKGILNKKDFSNLSLTAQRQMIHFLDNKDPECEMSDGCIRLLEGGIYKILRVYSLDGPDEAIELINKYLKSSDYTFFKKICNAECLNNSMQIYYVLKELITPIRKEKMQLKEELRALNDTMRFENGIENKIHELLNPLSHVLRLKILFNLQNGGRTYSQLEEDMGIKAGHLLFHMEKLINIGYVSQENKRYLLTIKGLKILNFLSGLREELFLDS